MKKLIYLFTCALALTWACNDDEIEEYKTYPFSVQLVYPAGSDYSARAGVEVHLLNTVSGVAFDTVTNDAGRADFIVPAGVYELSATDVRSEGGVADIFNGVKSNITVTDTWDASTPVQLTLTVSRAGQVLVKELYIGGCQKDDGSGVFQMDKYVILYNNSGYTASIDSLAFGMIYPYNATGGDAYYDESGGLSYENAGWVPAGSGFWYFTSSVTLEPGEQVVVAINGAIDNTATYSNSVNLANDKYYCMYDIVNFPNTTYYPAPSAVIPTSHYLLSYRFASGNAWVLSTSCPAFIIFTPKETSLNIFSNNPETSDPTSGTVLTRKMLPTSWIVDGVDVFRHGAANNFKRAPAVVDAGYVDHIIGAGYSIYRNVDAAATLAIEENAGKIIYNYSFGTVDVEGSTDPSGIDAEASLKNGARIIYKDTNNSSNDFHLRSRASLKN
ncbi:MAG: DUF4876 domain-containing protein [Odoribacteraceae bacterium]|nr:DUF4876 domain-containing protein [Odoribacteraceae bacterium]